MSKWFFMTVVIAACGFPRPPDVKAIGGNVHGIWAGAEGVALRLTADSVDTLYTVTANGPFTFPAGLNEGVSYAATVVSSPARHTCTINAGGVGIVGASGVSTVDVACAGPPVTVAVSAPGPWRFDPTLQVQPTFDASMVLQEVTGTVGSPDGKISGDTVAVGAFGEDSASVGVNQDQANNNANHSGAVYVYRRSATVWSQEAYIKASNTGQQDNFGFGVALSGDTLAVGAFAEASPATGINQSQGDGAAGAGAVYIYQRTGSTWSEQAYVKAFNTQPNYTFGCSVALDGETLAVGSCGESSSATGINQNQTDRSAPRAGAAYVFTRTNGVWSQQAYIKASNTDPNDGFGVSLSLYHDTLAVGAFHESSAASGVDGNQNDNNAMNAGAVYVFHRTSGTWAQQAYIKASNTKATDEFGSTVSVFGDILLVGSHMESNSATGVDGSQTGGGASASGAAYVFERVGTTWSQRAYLKASNTGQNDLFGSSVAASGDMLVVTAQAESSSATGFDGDQSKDDADKAGAIYLFR